MELGRRRDGKGKVERSGASIASIVRIRKRVW